MDDVLDCLAPEETKGPVHEDIVTGSEGDAHQDKEEVCHRQVQDQQVGGVLHLGVGINLEHCLIILAVRGGGHFGPP